MTGEYAAFRQRVFDHYTSRGRGFPWRDTHDPYAIWVSEIMLQQTQTERVVPKYEAFLERFPTVHDLAKAPVDDVLRLWQGLGYNRRGLSLQKGAQQVVAMHGGEVPAYKDGLLALPGIGQYTAGAILAFAFNQPVAMIETNIRRVYIHEFFADSETVDDKQLMPLIEKTVDTNNPREWYYALMDYGAWLAKQVPNPNRKSKHYTRQSTFKGSLRELRGEILRRVLRGEKPTAGGLAESTGRDIEVITQCMRQLAAEGFPIPVELDSIQA